MWVNELDQEIPKVYSGEGKILTDSRERVITTERTLNTKTNKQNSSLTLSTPLLTIKTQDKL